MKKTLWLYPLIFVLSILILPAGVLAHDPYDDNPIDASFNKIFDEPLKTSEYNYITARQVAHWQAEFYNIAALLKDRYNFKEDKQKISDFVAIVDKQAKTLSEMEKINWSDFEQPPAKRTYGTGAVSAMRNTEAATYRAGFFLLLANFNYHPDVKYEYIFKESPLDRRPNEI